LFNRPVNYLIHWQAKKLLVMKKFEKLGRKLSKEEQKKIMGGNPPE
jgi:hypothetical protein